jgi:hypothetical protein
MRSLLVFWPHSVFWTKSLVYKRCCKQEFHYSEWCQKILPASQKNSSSLSAVRTIEPSRPDAHLSTVPVVWTTCHTVRTLYCIEKLLYQLAYVRTTFSDRPASDSFQVQNKGRSIEPSGRCWSPVRTRVSIRQESQFKYHGPDISQPKSGRACN